MKKYPSGPQINKMNENELVAELVNVAIHLKYSVYERKGIGPTTADEDGATITLSGLIRRARELQIDLNKVLE